MKFHHKPKLIFYLLLLIFMIPLVSAWYLFKHHNNWVHHTTNRGILLNPILPIDQLTLTDYNIPVSINPKRWRNNWLMLYIKSNNCDQRCLTNIYLMGQTRTALGKYQNKILTIYVAVNPDINNNPSSEILRQYARTILVKTTDTNIFNFFSKPALTYLSLEQGQLFLVDPNGFVMMRYPSTISFEDVYQDLNHLLTLGNNS